MQVASSSRLVAVAVSDGVGSRQDSHHGSRAAVDAACDHAVRHYADGVDLLALVRSTVLAARQAVADEAVKRGKPPSELACNLSLALIDHDDLMIGSVGDCVQALRYADGTVGLVAMQTDKEFAQFTDTLVTSDLGSTLLTYGVGVDDVDGVVLGSDGFGELAVRGPTTRPRPDAAMINGLLDAVRLEGWTTAHLAAMFRGKDIADRVTDDITIAMLHVRGHHDGRPVPVARGGLVHIDGSTAWPSGGKVKSFACSEAGGLVLVEAGNLSVADIDAAIARPPIAADGFAFAWPTDRAELRRNGTMLLVRPWGGPPAAGADVPAKIRALVASMADAGFAHGQLRDDLFASDAYGNVQLRECRTVLQPGSIEARRAADCAYVAARVQQ